MVNKIMIHKKNNVRYKRWQKATCIGCGNKWLEIWAFVWNENGKECATPVLVCPNNSCATLINAKKRRYMKLNIFDPSEYDLSDDDLQSTETGRKGN